MIKGHALVLNKHWTPVATTSVRTALVLLCRETASVICPETYEAVNLDEWIKRSSDAPTDETPIRTPRHPPTVSVFSIL